MEQWNALPLSRKLLLGAGVLLLIDTFFAWQKWSAEVAGVEVISVKANAWHGFFGVVLGLLTIALLGWLIARLLGVELPAAIPDGVATLAVGGGILVCALLKNLIDDYSAWASYVGVVLAAGVAYGAWLAFQESGESLPSMGAASSDAAAPPPAEPPSRPAGTDPV
jgi:hypothetical protein